jgi:23S rRNA pseudouridine1911/1915/1917 synthase
VARHLAAEGHHRSASAVRKLVVAGSVRVGGRVERFLMREMAPGEAVGVRLPPVGRANAAPVTLTETVVRFEDDVLIVVDKPAGLPTHATIDPNRPHLHGAVADLLARRSGGPDRARPYLGIHHRLDRDTTGVVLFTKDRRVNAAVGALFAQRRIGKTYLAAVTGRRPAAARWTVQDHLGRVSGPGDAARYASVHAGGQAAHTDFDLVGPLGADRWLVRAHPRTGRTHQLRVHLAEAGLPIVGDEHYGGPPAPAMLLHAESLAFTHPLTGAELVVTAPAPPALRAPAPG